MEFEPMLTPREKSPLLEKFPRGGSNPRRCGQQAQTLPTSYSDPNDENNDNDIERVQSGFCTIRIDQDSGKASASRAGDTGIKPSFPWSSHSSDLKICTGTLMAALPGTWHDWVARTGWTGVSVLWLGDIAWLICNLCLSMTAHTVVEDGHSLKLVTTQLESMLYKRSKLLGIYHSAVIFNNNNNNKSNLYCTIQH